jgi:hypothetical protein
VTFAVRTASAATDSCVNNSTPLGQVKRACPALKKGAIARGAAAAAKNSRVCLFLAHKLVNAALNKGEIV